MELDDWQDRIREAARVAGEEAIAEVHAGQLTIADAIDALSTVDDDGDKVAA